MTKEKSHLQHIADASYKRAYAKRYYHANKVKARLYYHVNKDKIKARSEAWRVANRERYLAQQADYDKNRRVIPLGKIRINEVVSRVKKGRTPKERYYPANRY